MGVKRYVASKDTTITNAYKSNLSTRGTGSNMGAADVLELFSIYGQAQELNTYTTVSGTFNSQELSRILIEFPTTNIQTDRTNEDIPGSGSVDFYLRMFNAKHGSTTPKNAKVVIATVDSAWEEGFGLDMVEYKDDTRNEEGANWINSASNASWDNVGGDYSKDRRRTYEFSDGTEDIEVDVTDVVEAWLAGTISNNGFGLFLTGTQEAYFSGSNGTDEGSLVNNLTGSRRSYYTKKFFARSSEFTLRKPVIEARWDSSKKDNRGNLLYSSSLLPKADNLNTIYFYNYVRGQLKNIDNAVDGKRLYVQIFSGSRDSGGPTGSAISLVPAAGGVLAASDAVPTVETVITGGLVSTGIYSATFAITSSVTDARHHPQVLHDMWFGASTPGVGDHKEVAKGALFTGSLVPEVPKSVNYNYSDSYVISMPDLKDIYDSNEKASFRVYTRNKNWSPSIYSKATAETPINIIEDLYYRLYRVADGFEVVAYGTGSVTPQLTGSEESYTRLSYDSSGSYFDFDMTMLVPDYAYAFKFLYYTNNSYKEYNRPFKFRVERLDDKDHHL